MTLQRDFEDRPAYRARAESAWLATRRREGIGTILVVVVISALIIAALSYIMEPPSPAGSKPEPSVTYRAQ